jgi:hypothetical protein
MPKKDGTGPKGIGPMTGFGNGKCIIPLDTTKEELNFLRNQKKSLSKHLAQIEIRISMLEKINQKKD